MIKKFLLTAITLIIAATAFAQQDASSSGSVVRRRGAADRNKSTDTPGVTHRMQSRLGTSEADESELQWMRVMYRELDLTKDENGALYYPDEPVEGQENLFRIIMHRMADGSLPGYEYLDGREVFNEDFLVKMNDVLDRFYIPYNPAKGSTEKNPKYTIEESDIPTTEVLSYYIIERWEFDKRQNRMRTVVEAICPVLHRSGDFGGEAVKYPMFWVRYADLRPYLSTQNIFTDDDNNLATCTYDDFFQLGLYKGDIYKTRNLKNRSLMQMHPDPDELAHARDSIQQRLDSYEKKLWVPSLEELKERREAAEKAEAEAEAAAAAAESEGSDAVAPAQEKPKTNVRSSRSKRGTTSTKPAKKAKTPKVKKPKSSGSSSSSATRSVRNRRR
ncbi:MAG: gliding motility protein GldN [Muribaculaceae bacterium]|nr:gliding motility protein GldN [Muribaculaceae bacterium]